MSQEQIPTTRLRFNQEHQLIRLIDTDSLETVADVHATKVDGRYKARYMLARLFAEAGVISRALEALTPGGSEFHQDPMGCIAWIKDRLDYRDRTHVELAQAKQRICELEAIVEGKTPEVAA